MPELRKTPMLDQLLDGPFPSFVKEIKKGAEKNDACNDLLGQLELSYEEKITHWKHGGIVGVTGYGGGVIGRYSDVPDKFPGLTEFHTMRINQPAGWFYKTDRLRKLLDIWEKRGSGLTNFHGATGDIILLGTHTDQLQAVTDDLAREGWDLGGSGSDLRTPSACVGPGRCEWACIDTLDIVDTLTRRYQNELHRPMWPYKFKIKIAGCANDGVASKARADFSIIGTWKDNIQINRTEVVNYVNAGFDIIGQVVDKCPTKCISYNPVTKSLSIDNSNCVRCHNCINKMPKALRQGKITGATILIGGHAPILQSAFMSWVIVPFMEMKPPYDEVSELLEKIWEWWDENGKMRERVGELIYRLGMRSFLQATGLPAVPQMVLHPRTNPFYFWSKEEVNQ
ncbi:dissimilatory-type sulfite reductase subunit alpha [Thermodesulfobium sp.]|jgi:sulfite reductase alpha subunit|uniref:Dissimilatory-type sulfite reductase subunit alpha n=1 Tax=Thermodesulfobium narugense TaxID=184064 RepID=A0A7C5P9S4_9BACT